MFNEQACDPAADALEAGLAAMANVSADNETDEMNAPDSSAKQTTVPSSESNLSRPKSGGLLGVPDPIVNRRLAQRYPARWRASGQILGGKGFMALTEDISATGVLFNSSARLPVGTRAYLKLHTYCFGVAREIVVGVEVMHASLCGDTYRSGARFTTVKPKDKRFFERYAVGANPHVR